MMRCSRDLLLHLQMLVLLHDLGHLAGLRQHSLQVVDVVDGGSEDLDLWQSLVRVRTRSLLYHFECLVHFPKTSSLTHRRCLPTVHWKNDWKFPDSPLPQVSLTFGPARLISISGRGATIFMRVLMLLLLLLGLSLALDDDLGRSGWLFFLFQSKRFHISNDSSHKVLRTRVDVESCEVIEGRWRIRVRRVVERRRLVSESGEVNNNPSFDSVFRPPVLRYRYHQQKRGDTNKARECGEAGDAELYLVTAAPVLCKGIHRASSCTLSGSYSI